MSLKAWLKMRPLKEDNLIEKIEKTYGFRLSDSLRNCLKEYNAGIPTPNVIRFKNGNESDVKRLLSYNEDDCECIYKIIDYFIKEYGGKIIPFALDSAGNYYCEQQGNEIVYWTQEQDIFPVCGDFEEFLKSLYDID